MPELPDITVYVEALDRYVVGKRLERVRIIKPFVLRSFHPQMGVTEGLLVTSAGRIGKRLVIGLESHLFIVIHLMISGRLRWLAAGAKLPAKIGLAAFDFDSGSLILTEAGSKRRASITLVQGAASLEAEANPPVVRGRSPADLRSDAICSA
jgi:formamidopyrimidine-DNA glycosylase